MQLRYVMTAALLVAAVSIAGAGSAGAATKAEPTAQLVGKVKINKDGTGTVKAHYICSGEGWHLWVSAKQTADGSFNPALTGEGSGFAGVADTWLQSHPTDFTCDGKWHTQKFEINKEEAIPEEFGGGTIGRGALVPGQAWVQFCLINEAQGLFLIDQQWRGVG